MAIPIEAPVAAVEVEAPAETVRVEAPIAADSKRHASPAVARETPASGRRLPEIVELLFGLLARAVVPIAVILAVGVLVYLLVQVLVGPPVAG